MLRFEDVIHTGENLCVAPRFACGINPFLPNHPLSGPTSLTEGFQVPMLAWTLGVHTLGVQASPLTGAPLPPPPNVIFQARAQRHAHLLPFVRAWHGVHYRLVAHVRTFRVYEANCRG